MFLNHAAAQSLQTLWSSMRYLATVYLSVETQVTIAIRWMMVPLQRCFPLVEKHCWKMPVEPLFCASPHVAQTYGDSVIDVYRKCMIIIIFLR